MATRTFTSMVQFQAMIEPMIQKAIENASQRLCEELRNFIQDDYYSLYKPKVYKRSYDFLNSASTQMLSSNSAKIFMDADAMDYNDYWDGETQLYMADAGFHGNVSIFREGYFWKDFIAWCDQNALKILREELKKQGLNTV